MDRTAIIVTIAWSEFLVNLDTDEVKQEVWGRKGKYWRRVPRGTSLELCAIIRAGDEYNRYLEEQERGAAAPPTEG